jgi:hypothetical protein
MSKKITLNVLGKKVKVKLDSSMITMAGGVIASGIGHSITAVFKVIELKDNSQYKKFNESVMKEIKNRATSGDITKDELGFVLMEHMKEISENRNIHKKNADVVKYVDNIIGRALATSKNSEKYKAGKPA